MREIAALSGLAHAKRKVEMKINADGSLARWTCIRLHLNSRLSRRFPLRCLLFHLAGIWREFSPRRGYTARQA
jgi:hypothetical protein